MDYSSILHPVNTLWLSGATMEIGCKALSHNLLSTISDAVMYNTN